MNSPDKSPINLWDKIPPGFRLCEKCGEYTGTTQSKYLRWRESHPRLATPEEPVSVRCLCEGILCKYCGKRLIHRPVSNSYDSDDNSIWHWPWFTGMTPCEDCKNRDGRGMRSSEDKRFPLPKLEQGFETKRTLVGLYKLGPLETEKEFAERIVKAFREYQAKNAAKRKSDRKGELPA